MVVVPHPLINFNLVAHVSVDHSVKMSQAYKQPIGENAANISKELHGLMDRPEKKSNVSICKELLSLMDRPKVDEKKIRVADLCNPYDVGTLESENRRMEGAMKTISDVCAELLKGNKGVPERLVEIHKLLSDEKNGHSSAMFAVHCSLHLRLAAVLHELLDAHLWVSGEGIEMKISGTKSIAMSLLLRLAKANPTVVYYDLLSHRHLGVIWFYANPEELQDLTPNIYSCVQEKKWRVMKLIDWTTEVAPHENVATHAGELLMALYGRLGEAQEDGNDGNKKQKKSS